MEHTIIEIKVKVFGNDAKIKIREILRDNNAEFRGLDIQTDTYFNIPKGRLKIRRGNIENYLIYYERENNKGPKKSDVICIDSPSLELEKLLKSALGILIKVNKKREIYYIENVKFHIDDVVGLGKFFEIEAIGENHERSKLKKQCEYYMSLLGIDQSILISESYSDLLKQKKKKEEK